MRGPRVKNPQGTETTYHSMSHLVHGVYLNHEEMAHLSALGRRVADFLDIRIITDNTVPTHFHFEIVTPSARPDDAAILERIEAFHGADLPWVKALRGHMDQHKKLPDDARENYLRMWGDISLFHKMVKQRFSIHYNALHPPRKGTLWRERFKSVELKPDMNPQLISPRLAVALYVDLNSVRCGLAGDPKDWPHCGYARAVKGDPYARAGLTSLFSGLRWEEAHAIYRRLLFAKGAVSQREGQKTIPLDRVLRAIREGEELEWSELCSFDLDYLANGQVVGTKEFVEAKFDEFRGAQYPNARKKAQPAPGWKDVWYMGQRPSRRPISEPETFEKYAGEVTEEEEVPDG